ncbi:MAG: diaminopimelate epimerase [Sedimenticola sp.]
MELHFTKMHGLGNDFVMFNAIDQAVKLTPEQCRFIAHRHTGIGCDQILVIEPPRDNNTDFYYRIFNSDGSEVEQCGNGARCFAHFVQQQGLTDKTEIDVGTCNGNLRLFIEKSGLVRVNMGAPRLEPEQIPFIADRRADSYPFTIEEETLTIGAVSMGNPHAILIVENVASAPVSSLGALLEKHSRFPQKANVGFMEICSRSQINLRVFERGTGETMACGSGACAAVVSGRTQGLLDERVEVSLTGGKLVIEWAGDDMPVWMSGPTATVYQGTIEL